jgi:hypothetical protein
MRGAEHKNLTTQKIVEAIRWGSDLFDSIAADTYHYRISTNNAAPGLSRKQYYARLSKLIKVGTLSGIGEEFIAMQLDIEIPDVIKVLKELDVYKSPN